MFSMKVMHTGQTSGKGRLQEALCSAIASAILKMPFDCRLGGHCVA